MLIDAIPKFINIFSIAKIEMGASLQNSLNLLLTQTAPPLQNFHLHHSGSCFYVWQHNLQNQQMIQFPIVCSTAAQEQMQQDLYLFRYRHQYLVSSLYFKAGDNKKGSIFIQRVYTNLSRIKDVPFEDSLMFYYVSLQGFQLLYQKYGYFQVEQNMFHITKNKKVKVWPNKNIQKPFEFNSNQVKGTENNMVQKIIHLIQKNCDPINSFPVGSHLYHSSSTFSSCLQKFQQICLQNNFTVPQKLTCLDIICQGEVGEMLDEYGEKKRQSFTEGNQNQIEEIIPMTFTDVKFIEENGRQSRKSLKKGKGLRISHSLQKTNQNNTISRTNNSGSPLSRNIRQPANLPLQSPIKILTKQSHPPLPNRSPQFHQIVHPPPPPQYFPPSPKVAFLRSSPSQPVFRNVFTPSHLPQPQQIPMPAAHLLTPQPKQSPQQQIPDHMKETPKFLTRRSSFDLNVNENTQSQFHVVVNYADKVQRPQSANKSMRQTQVNFTNNTNNNRNSYLNVVNNVQNVQQSLPLRVQNFIPQPQPQPQMQQRPQIPIQPKQAQKNYNSPLTKNNDYIFSRPPTPPPLSKPSNENKTYGNFDLYDPEEYKQKNSYNFSTQNIDKQEPSYNSVDPLKDYTNFKARFEEYKKSFDFSKDYKKSDFSYQTSKVNNSNTKPLKPFFQDFGNIPDTVSSYVETDNFSSKKTTEKSLPKQTKQTKQNIPFSHLYPVPSAYKEWRQQSVVVQHDVNKSKIQMPQSKHYVREMDSDIWKDVMKIREKSYL